ncbi:hypothetical protein M427DRAFT_144091 [Gonapodya prolifera JEL478]|uniref:Small ribosomal subunit protein uS10 domain-containing protein n=1 Tax=Gonapodya prolifera (strain JEL478) TaxID=1344416 RepID=A0A139AMP6_GONPJ|nr:hypothetical protein M427DRAFT_144091 [Gonapodya prolifera JEL478]|eukprot:KXS18019.1 hypothetical protein M427DRAFT_144091 [Gonapodya prolifera JEL478]
MGSEPLEIPIPPRVARPPNPILTARLTLTAAMPDHLRLMAHFARHAAAHLNLRTAPGTWVRPNLRRFRILKSPFVHAKSKEIFERRVHAMTVDVHNGHWETQRAWVDYVVAATPPGIKVTLEEWTRENVGYGKRLEAAANDELGRRSPEGGGVKKIAWPPRTVSDVVLQKAQVLLKQLGGPPLAAGGEKKAANDAKAGKAEKSGKGAKTEKR